MKKILSFVLAVVVLGTLVFCFITFMDWFFNIDIDKEYKIALISAFTAVFSFIWSNYVNSKKEIEARLFEKKSEAYGKLFEAFFDFVLNPERVDEVDLKEIIMLKKDLLIWGSSETIRAWNDYELASAVEGSNVLLSADTLFNSMRKDLGHSNSGMHKGELVKFFLNEEGKREIDEILKTNMDKSR